MELWGGHECTVNRVGDGYRDQTLLTGHQGRIEDLARFAAMGIRTLRYPVLWERVAPDHPDDRDWSWSDERLAEIDRLGMRPIVGLLHHGSGPRYTSLVDDDFVMLFAGHAAATAARYPHVADWTPINEPLTTARFSTLYGLWYPHARDEALFWRALLNQIDATRAAMKAIRRVNPAARLIQTEDLGQYYSTPELVGPAEHLNHRRWATWDLLAGRFSPDHALWDHVAAYGLADRLRAILDEPCPPDVIGVNFYPTSERFLDHRLDAYPFARPDAGYHDLTAVRVLDPPAAGLAGLLRQAWGRYGHPLAVTECHLGCSREEQLRWLWQSWQGCLGLEQDGVDVRALTAWALLGNVDWNSLITVEAGHYEPGAFDVRSGVPRPTAIAGLLKTIATGVRPTPADFPALHGQGWWQRDIRLEHAPFAWSAPLTPSAIINAGRPILIYAAGGPMRQCLEDECRLRGLRFLLVDPTVLAAADPSQVDSLLDEHRPWALIDMGGAGPSGLAAACARRGVQHALFAPEAPVSGTEADSLVIATGALFSSHDPRDFALAVERALRMRLPLVASHHRVAPTYLPDLVRAGLDLIVDDARGTWHLTNGVELSWVEFGRLIAVALDLDVALVRAAPPSRPGLSAGAPGTSGAALLPSLKDAIARHAATRRAVYQREVGERTYGSAVV